MDMTDAMVMGLVSFKIALAIHIAGALLLFAAVGLETLTTILLRSARSISQIRLAAQIGRGAPPVFGLASALVFLSGTYLTYLDWHYGEEIGWIIVAATAFVVLGIYSAIIGRRYAYSLKAEIVNSNGELPKGLVKLARSRARVAQIGISVGLILGILAVMIFQPSVSMSILVLINALAYGLIFSLTPMIGRNESSPMTADRTDDALPED